MLEWTRHFTIQLLNRWTHCRMVRRQITLPTVSRAGNILTIIFSLCCTPTWLCYGPYSRTNLVRSMMLWSPFTSSRHHLSYDDCLENTGRLQDCSCSIGSYHCIQCHAHILWAAPTGQTDLSLTDWVHFTVLRCRDVKRSSNIRTSKKIFEFEFVFDPSKFDFQIPTGLNSAKSVLWLH